MRARQLKEDDESRNLISLGQLLDWRSLVKAKPKALHQFYSMRHRMDYWKEWGGALKDLTAKWHWWWRNAWVRLFIFVFPTYMVVLVPLVFWLTHNIMATRETCIFIYLCVLMWALHREECFRHNHEE